MIIKNRYPNISDLYELKERIFTAIKIDKLVLFLKKLNITPNQITIISIVFGILAVFYIEKSHNLFVIFYLLNRISDGVDGYYARKQNLSTKLGSHLDHFGDYFVHSVLLIKVGILFSLDLAFIAAIAYTIEFIFLEIKKLTQYKFPTSIFAYFFIFEAYKTGLNVQLIYQFVSVVYFYFTFKPKTKE